MKKPMQTVTLPAQIKANGLLSFLSQLGTARDKDVVMDFTALRKVTPAGLVALTATVARWKKEGRSVNFRGLSECSITEYLQRMDLLKACEVKLPEDFQRHDAKGRFVPVRPVAHPVDTMGHEMAACLAPGGEEYGHPKSELYDLAWYVLTEAGNNVRQHSGGSGYASAQVNRFEGFVRLALADNGMGILQSFRNAGVPWSHSADDLGAIQKALEPRVSCKPSDPNEGVGLTLVSNLAQLMKAWLLIVSGQGVLQINEGSAPKFSVLPENGNYRGTLVALTFKQSSVHNYFELLHEAKIRAGLLRTGRATGKFDA